MFSGRNHVARTGGIESQDLKLLADVRALVPQPQRGTGGGNGDQFRRYVGPAWVMNPQEERSFASHQRPVVGFEVDRKGLGGFAGYGVGNGGRCRRHPVSHAKRILADRHPGQIESGIQDLSITDARACCRHDFVARAEQFDHRCVGKAGAVNRGRSRPLVTAAGRKNGANSQLY